MPRPPSKHGLERKYKSWRKGQSKIAAAARSKASSTDDGQTQNTAQSSSTTSSIALTKGGSLKNQLRSQRRLLAKIGKAQGNGNDNDGEYSKQRQIIEERIQQIEDALAERDRKQREKNNATKYHTIKFFERQKLTRMERKVQKKLQEAKEAADFEDIEKHTSELQEVVLNQLYVAYFPNHLKYISLFPNNSNSVDEDALESEERFGDVNVLREDQEKNIKRRMEIREEILDKIRSKEIDCTKSWVNMKLIKSVLESTRTKRTSDSKDTTTTAKRKVNDTNATAKPTVNSKNNKKPKKMDQQVESTKTSEPMTKKRKGNNCKVAKLTAEKVKDDKKSTSDSLVLGASSDDDSDSDATDNDAESDNSSIENNGNEPEKENNDTAHDSDQEEEEEANSDSDSDSSSAVSSSSESSSDSDSSSDEGTNAQHEKATTQTSAGKDDRHTLQMNNQDERRGESDEESEDDFFVDDDKETDIHEVFANASTDIRTYDEFAKGDKSRGWATQKQRPGEWKGKKRRR